MAGGILEGSVRDYIMKAPFDTQYKYSLYSSASLYMLGARKGSAAAH